MTGENFRNALRADPDDTLTRQVYADWLDDHGEPARAELVRVQTAAELMDEDDPARLPLEKRQRELLIAHEGQWLKDRPQNVREWRWRGGTIDHVGVYRDGRLHGVGALCDQHPVTSLSFIGEWDSKELTGFSHASVIRSLELQKNDGQRNARRLHALIGCGKWESLRRFVVGGSVDEQVVNVLCDRGPATIRELELPPGTLSESGLTRLVTGPALPELHSLHLSWYTQRRYVPPILSCGRPWRSLDLPQGLPLAPLLHCTHLKKLKVVLERGQGLPEPPAIEDLTITPTWNGNASLEIAAALGCLPQLRRLTLQLGRQVPWEGFTHLAQILAGLSRAALCLQNGQFTPYGIAQLQRATPNLRELHLLSPEHFAQIEDGVLTGLRVLHVGDPNPTLDDLRFLWSPGLRNLRDLRLLGFLRDLDRIIEGLTHPDRPFVLRTLHLRGGFTRRSLEQLALWPGLAELDDLELSASPRLPDPEALDALARSRYLCPLTRFRPNGFAISRHARDTFYQRLGKRFRG